MWSAISKIFTKNSSASEVSSYEQPPPDEMDRGECKNHYEAEDSFSSKLVSLQFDCIFVVLLFKSCKLVTLNVIKAPTLVIPIFSMTQSSVL